jgi:predicted transcriptional regulator
MLPSQLRKSGGKIVNAVYTKKSLAKSQPIFKPKKSLMAPGLVSFPARRPSPHRHLSAGFQMAAKASRRSFALPDGQMSSERTFFSFVQ